MMENNKAISFQIKGIELLDVQINHSEEPLKTQITFQFDISLEHRINANDKLIILICSINVNDEENSAKLGFLRASCIFEVNNIADFMVNKQINFPDTILNTLNSITISTVRGIMFSQFKGTFLHNAHLPVINPQSFTVDK